MHRHSSRAVTVIAAAAGLDVILGLAFSAADHVSVPDGLYWATTTATTVGYGDIVPRGWLPHLLAVGVMVTVIPLFASAFSLVTSGLSASNVRISEARIKRHLEDRLRHHLGGAANPMRTRP